MLWKHLEVITPRNSTPLCKQANIIATVSQKPFWKTVGLLLKEWLLQGTTINSKVYCDTLCDLDSGFSSGERGNSHVRCFSSMIMIGSTPAILQLQQWHPWGSFLFQTHHIPQTLSVCSIC